MKTSCALVVSESLRQMLETRRVVVFVVVYFPFGLDAFITMG